MALTGTTLASAVAASDIAINVDSATGFTAGYVVRIDSEFMVVDASYVSGTKIPVRMRGSNGSAAAAHAETALVVVGITSDFAGVQPGAIVSFPPDGPQIVSYTTSGAVALPTYDTVASINSTGIAALTLANPPKDVNGLSLQLVSASTYAHTLTYSTGFFGGSTSDDVATFTGGLGSSLSLKAFNGVWTVVGQSTNVTIG